MNVNKILLKYSSEGRLTVLFGVYIDNRSTDQQEIDYLIEAMKAYPGGRIEGVVVGNEVMYRNTLPKSVLIQRIQEVRNKVRGLGDYNGNESYRTAPIYAVEIFPDPEIGAASDALGLNIHPFYRPDLVDVADPDEMADKILKAAQEQIDLYRNMLPSKQIVVTEIGWPTQSDPTELHRGDPIIALKFLEKFTAYAAGSGFQTYWFELFDSPWKYPMYPSNQKSMSEFNFGLYKADRTTIKKLEDYGYTKAAYYSTPSPQPHQPSPSPSPLATTPHTETYDDASSHVASGGESEEVLVPGAHSSSYAESGTKLVVPGTRGSPPYDADGKSFGTASGVTHPGVPSFVPSHPVGVGHPSTAGHRYGSFHGSVTTQPYRRLLGMGV